MYIISDPSISLTEKENDIDKEIKTLNIELNDLEESVKNNEKILKDAIDKKESKIILNEAKISLNEEEVKKNKKLEELIKKEAEIIALKEVDGRERIKYYPIIYYSFANNDNINKNRYKYFTKKENNEENLNFLSLYKEMNDKENVYNKNNINILLITIILVWLSILLIVLKVLSKILGENYGKVMLVLTIILLIIGVIYSLFIVKKKM